MRIFNEISRLPEFEKDIKKLLKRFKTLKDDLKTFIEKEMFLYHKLKIDNKGIFQIQGLPLPNLERGLPTENPKVYKAKKFACRSLKGKGAQSGIRVIYAYFEEKDKIDLIEIYYKGEKKNENRERILRYYGK